MHTRSGMGRVIPVGPAGMMPPSAEYLYLLYGLRSLYLGSLARCLS
jgi:hypothetical protein